ncbi:hypothetical protein [Brucella intermedia]|uniref:hypothetical protein n=1 Tax=Brucella intermedia TaxID=94625 RepID=UPI0023617E45|nr:hypothetical protein [Brucella intermedia]
MSKYNKFWAAAVMAVVAFIRSYFGIDLGVDEATANAIVAAITALLVWLIPNRRTGLEKPGRR